MNDADKQPGTWGNPCKETTQWRTLSHIHSI